MRKHVKPPLGALGSRPEWNAVRASLGHAVRGKAAGVGLSLGGGVGALLGITHQLSPAALGVVGAVIVAGLIASCIECRYRQQRGIIEARGAADRDKANADTRARESQSRSEMRLVMVNRLLANPEMAPVIGPLMARLDLLSLAEMTELTSEFACIFGELIADVRPGDPPGQTPPPAGLTPIPRSRPHAITRPAKGYARPTCHRAWRHPAWGDGENPHHLF